MNFIKLIQIQDQYTEHIGGMRRLCNFSLFEFSKSHKVVYYNYYNNYTGKKIVCSAL